MGRWTPFAPGPEDAARATVDFRHMVDWSDRPSTVRRAVLPWTASVHAFLNFLEERGFEAPHSRGVDAENQEGVSWIEGWVSPIPFEGPLLRNRGLRSVGRLLRQFHEVSRKYRPPANAIWAHGSVPKQRGDVMRHGDIGAGNIVWRSGKAVAFIDFEFAVPGPAVDDLAMAAWTLVPLVPPAGQARAGFPDGAPLRMRLEALCAGYGEYTPEDVIEAYRFLVEVERDRRLRLGTAGVEPWAQYVRQGQIDQMDETMEWFDTEGRYKVL